MEASFIEIPDLWRGLAPEQLGGTVLVVGASDTGKSTLVRWLVDLLCQYHDRVGWLDGDVGQTTLGLPTTLNLALLEEAPVLLPKPRASYFIGSTSPRGHMLPLLVGLQRLQQIAFASGAKVLVVDTTGLVSKEAGGEALKRWKVELLQPQLILALQRQGELEPLLGPWRLDSRLRLVELPMAGAVEPRSAPQRIEKRRLLFRHYFEQGQRLSFLFQRVPVYGLELLGPGRLTGLLDSKGLVLALGVVVGGSANGLELFTPWRSLDRVAALRLGSLCIDPASGAEPEMGG